MFLFDVVLKYVKVPLHCDLAVMCVGRGRVTWKKWSKMFKQNNKQTNWSVNIMNSQNLNLNKYVKI